MKSIHFRINDELVKSGDDFNEFLRFCVRRWQHVILTRGTGVRAGEPSLRHFSQIPRTPSVSYLSPCLQAFTETWVREGNSNLAHLSPRDKAIAELMYREDLDYSEAVEVYAERKASQKVSERISRREASVKAREKELLKEERRKARQSFVQKHKPKPPIGAKKLKESSSGSESANNWRKTGGISKMSEEDIALHAEPLPSWEELHGEEDLD